MTAAFSFFINILMLTSPLYMMQIYNRVLPTRSEPTLIVLTGLVVGLMAVMAILEIVRSRLLVRVSGRLDLLMSGRILSAVFSSSLRGSANTAEGLRDFDAVRQFLTGAGILAFFDAPWTPLMIAVTFLFHPLLGVIATVGAVVLFALAALNEVTTRGPLNEANRQSAGTLAMVGSSLRNAETIEAMGMFGDLRRRWFERRHEMLQLQQTASDRAGAITAVSKTLRLLLQTALLGVGAWLVLQNEMSAGAIIASSIVVGRALAPIEMAIGSWKQFLAARSGWRRLGVLLTQEREPGPRTSLPKPLGSLTVETVTAVPPGGQTPTLRGLAVSVRPGEVLGVVGPSGSGKSTLARLMVGAWRPLAGKVRLDGADLHNWDRAELGPHIGYLPQEVELFDGSVAENIARFGELDAARIIAAAQRAGVHEMILRLPQGYETPIGAGGRHLSAGQRQRVGLARALYGDPVLVVLDEPNSNLDTEGEAALVQAILDMKQRGTAVVLVTHRPSVLGTMDNLLVLMEGEMRMYGPRAEVLAKLTRPVVAGEGEPRQALRN